MSVHDVVQACRLAMEVPEAAGKVFNVASDRHYTVSQAAQLMAQAKVREVLDRYRLEPEIWITETGFSTWKHDEHGQLRAFLQAIAAPVDRMYWYAAYDLHPDLPTQDGLHSDVRHR